MILTTNLTLIEKVADIMTIILIATFVGLAILGLLFGIAWLKNERKNG